MSEVLYYKCKKCGDSIAPNTGKKLIFCKCGKIGVDGTLVNSRIIGDKKFLIIEKEEKLVYSYRIKHVPTGLFFKPYSYPSHATFTKVGKIYSKKPSLSWVDSPEECVIEKYLMTVL
jgi:hypothetical protein